MAQITVCYNRNLDIGEEFARVVGSVLGYSFVGQWRGIDGIFVYEVGDKLDEAIEKFQNEDKYVRYAEKRDIETEKRWDLIELIKSEVEEIRDGGSTEKVKKLLERLD
jgi:hypothetical protein